MEERKQNEVECGHRSSLLLLYFFDFFFKLILLLFECPLPSPLRICLCGSPSGGMKVRGREEKVEEESDLLLQFFDFFLELFLFLFELLLLSIPFFLPFAFLAFHFCLLHSSFNLTFCFNSSISFSSCSCSCLSDFFSARSAPLADEI